LGERSQLATPVLKTLVSPTGGGNILNATAPERAGIEEILKQNAAGLAHILGNRDGIAIEKGADLMDEIQYVTERDLAIRNVDRDSTLLHLVKAALRRLQGGAFGNCTGCESPIGAKRLAAIPWALPCIQCQVVSDRDGLETNDDLENLINAA